MCHSLKVVAGIPVRNGESGLKKLWQLLSVPALAIAVTGCVSPKNLDVLAYDTCVARHPQEVALCEGPRQAYELEPTAFQARAAGIKPPADRSDKGRSTVIQPALDPVVHPSAIASGRSE